MSALSGVVNQGSFTGTNRLGQPVTGQRVERGHWTGSNETTGATFDAQRLNNPAGPSSHWGVTRTGPLGNQQYNDFTVVNRGDGQVQAYDLNRSGFQPLPQNPLGAKESFDASITGDPHFKVDGSINGENVNAAFDNQDVGTRTQYQGAGFKLDTSTVPWGGNGAAVVGEATVNTGFGRRSDAVTLNADGALTVNGEATTLTEGDPLKLNRTSSVALNEDGSYTVSSRNGKVTNTLSTHENPNGNYINIQSSVDGVQTVGWLQNQV